MRCQLLLLVLLLQQDGTQPQGSNNCAAVHAGLHSEGLGMWWRIGSPAAQCQQQSTLSAQRPFLPSISHAGPISIKHAVQLNDACLWS